MSCSVHRPQRGALAGLNLKRSGADALDRRVAHAFDVALRRRAKKAAEKLSIQWDEGAVASISDASMLEGNRAAAKSGKVEISFDATSVNTGTPAFDKHLQSADLFNAGNNL